MSESIGPTGARAVWVGERLESAGWRVKVAHARKVRDVAPRVCKTDKVDARVVA